MLKHVFLILDLGHGSEATVVNYTSNFSFVSEKIQCTYDAFYWKITNFRNPICIKGKKSSGVYRSQFSDCTVKLNPPYQVENW